MRRRRAAAWACALLLACAAVPLASAWQAAPPVGIAKPTPLAPVLPGETLGQRDSRLIRAELSTLRAQTPGVVDLYVVGVAGDGAQDVFRNEVAYLDTLMSKRFGAQGRVLTLVNHLDSFKQPRALATLANLQQALDGVGKVMDPREDVLLLMLTSHGSPEGEFYIEMPPLFEGSISPKQLRAALDASGIVNRVVVVSACYSGGFVPALRNADTVVMTAAARNRTSFGCESDATATWFGEAWLIDGLNWTTDFVAAFDDAKLSIRQWERDEDFEPSRPQMAVGARIRATLKAWRAHLAPAPEVPYPYD